LTIFSQVDLPHKVFQSDEKVNEAQTAKLKLTDLFSTPTISKINIVLFTNWIACSLGYYGISMGIGDIGPDLFVNFILVTQV